MRSITMFSCVSAVLGLATTAMADSSSGASSSAAPDPGSVFLQNITANGTGCTAQSLATQLSADFESLDIQLNEGFDAQVGPGIPVHERRKNCDIAFTVHVPAGWSFALTEAEYEGYAQLDPNVTGTQYSQYFFAGDYSKPTTAMTQLGYDGQGYDGVYERSDEIEATEWSACGVDRIANINMSVSVNNIKNKTGNGFMSLDYANIHVAGHTHWHFHWRPC